MTIAIFSNNPHVNILLSTTTAGILDALTVLKKVKSTSFDGSDVYCFFFDFCVLSLFEPLLLIFIISFKSLELRIARTTDIDTYA
jgi:hypothetical protein